MIKEQFFKKKKMCLFSIIHILMLGALVVHRTGAQTEVTFFHYYENMDDFFFTKFVIFVRVAQSSLECGSACLMDDCASFTMNNHTGSCRTYSREFYYCSAGKATSTGTSYFVRRKTDISNAPADCQDVQTMNSGPVPSGVYTVTPVAGLILDVLCEMVIGECPWTVFHNRFDGSLSFNRQWTDYEVGFGNTSHEFWLGNEGISALTSSADHECLIAMADWQEITMFAIYRTFSVGNASSNYRLTIENYSGDAGDAFSVHSGMMFSTPDVDNDIGTGFCAQDYQAGWWYEACQYANLNGQYRVYGFGPDEKAMQWGTFLYEHSYQPLKKAMMMTRKHETN